MNGMFYRGEVYYVYPTGNEIGSEQHAGRPAIIVSNSQNNKNSSTLEIVYLTTREKRPMQTHVHINAAGKLQESTALCEQIFTVDKLRLNDYIGRLCDKEMQDIEFGLMVSLGLDNYLSKLPALQQHRFRSPLLRCQTPRKSWKSSVCSVTPTRICSWKLSAESEE